MKNSDLVVMVLASREAPGTAAGGIHKAVLGQIAALQSQGVRVHLLTASHPCAQSARAMGATVDYSPAWHHSVKPALFPSFWLKLLRLRLDGGLRCVIHHSGRTWFWGHVFFPGIPQIQVFHRELVRPYRFFRRWLALSPGFAEFLRNHHSLGGWRKVSWAPNALLDEPPPWKDSDPNKGPVRIGFIGRAGPGKGTDTLMQAAAGLVADGHDFQIVCAGDGEAFITAEAARHGVADRVRCIGWQRQLGAFLESIDLLVLSSVKESFGLVLIEAMAHGKPVLSTRCHGPESIVVDGETGYLVPIGDAKALADGLRHAIQDPDRAAKCRAGYQRVLSHYLPEPVGRRLLQALGELGVRFGRTGVVEAISD
jgi:glycosyltransferase involved in cell wall biosynthesis